MVVVETPGPSPALAAEARRRGEQDFETMMRPLLPLAQEQRPQAHVARARTCVVVVGEERQEQAVARAARGGEDDGRRF